MSDSVTNLLDETARWRARDVQYWSGSFEKMVSLMPSFALEEFTAGAGSASNPHFKAVVREPRTPMEKPVPVGVVSNAYTLAQHKLVAEKCLDGIRESSVDPAALKCELGLTQLGEWMNFRIYFPDEFSYTPRDKEPLQLRLECFNSVDGSCRLVVFLGWLRFVCSNGMVIGETRAEIRELHNRGLDLNSIPRLIGDAMNKIEQERQRLKVWDKTKYPPAKLPKWVDGPVSQAWGKKAACRIYHICLTGHDVEIYPPFAPGTATEKSVRQLAAVPGAAMPACTLYDVSQALTWVATQRANAEERVEWQSNVSPLMNKLAKV